MRFYRVMYYNSQNGPAYGWFLTRREARAEARKFLRAFHTDSGARIKVEAVDIPATREGVYAALQEFAGTGRQRIRPDDPGPSPARV